MVELVGETGKLFLSVDCLLIDFGLVEKGEGPEYAKAIITAFLPVITLIVVTLLWITIKFIPVL